MNEPRLSKSQIQLLDSCSWKWKLRYLDSLKEPRTPFAIYAEEGTAFHKMTEEFFKNINPFKGKKFIKNKFEDMTKIQYFENFLNNFVNPLYSQSKNSPKYYFPKFQEKRLYSQKHNMSGIVDAIFVHHDNEYIVLDWKTGKAKSRESMREELGYYKLLADEILDKPVKYGAMFFAKTGKLFFEEIEPITIKTCIDKMDEVRKLITEKRFEKKGGLCFCCGFNKKYMGDCDGKQ